jgi:hypothetical protein
MFETSQQSPSGGNTKTVAVVIVVGVVVMAVVYFAFLRGGQPAGEQAAPAAAAAATAQCGSPDAQNAEFLRDLGIQNFNLGRDQTQTMAMWDIQISNRSRTVCYRNIRYGTNYYDNAGNLIYQNEGVLPGELVAGDQRTISGINDGLYPLATTRFTIEIRAAEAY